MTLPQMFTTIEKAHRAVFIGVLVLLMCLLFLCLLRAVKGPRVADRIVAVNMMGTMVMVMIAALALLLGEGYLVDICLIYAMVSFISVIVLTKVYMGVYRQRKILQEAAEQKAGTAAAPNGAVVSCGNRGEVPGGNGAEMPARDRTEVPCGNEDKLPAGNMAEMSAGNGTDMSFGAGEECTEGREADA